MFCLNNSVFFTQRNSKHFSWLLYLSHTIRSPSNSWLFTSKSMTGSYKMNKYSSRRESGPFQFSSQREGIRDRLPIANSHILFPAPGNFVRAFDVCLASNYCNYLIKKSPRVPTGFTFSLAPCPPLFPLPWTTLSSLSLHLHFTETMASHVGICAWLSWTP